MRIDSLLTDTLTIVHRGDTADEWGNIVAGETSRTTVKGRLEQIGGQEVTRNRQTVIADWKLWLMPDILIDADDQVEVGAAVFEVVLRIPRTTPHSGSHHQEVLLRHIQG